MQKNIRIWDYLYVDWLTALIQGKKDGNGWRALKTINWIIEVENGEI